MWNPKLYCVKYCFVVFSTEFLSVLVKVIDQGIWIFEVPANVLLEYKLSVTVRKEKKYIKHPASVTDNSMPL